MCDLFYSQEAGKGSVGGPKTWCIIVNASALFTFRCLATTFNLSQASSSRGIGRFCNEAAMAPPGSNWMSCAPKSLHQ